MSSWPDCSYQDPLIGQSKGWLCFLPLGFICKLCCQSCQFVAYRKNHDSDESKRTGSWSKCKSEKFKISHGASLSPIIWLMIPLIFLIKELLPRFCTSSWFELQCGNLIGILRLLSGASWLVQSAISNFNRISLYFHINDLIARAYHR